MKKVLALLISLMFLIPVSVFGSTEVKTRRDILGDYHEYDFGPKLKWEKEVFELRFTWLA